MTKMPSFIRGIILSAILMVGCVNQPRAQAVTEWIRDPLPNELKERVATLLQTVRPDDVDVALASTKIVDDGRWRSDGWLLIRVEADCRAGLCMTMIARVTSGDIIAELILQAGRQVIVTDVNRPLWGAGDTWLPIIFEGTKGSGIGATRRNGVWVVTACGQCVSSFDPVPKPPEPERQPRPETTFDDVQRDLGLAPEQR